MLKKILFCVSQFLILYGMYYVIADIWKVLERWTNTYQIFTIIDIIVCASFALSAYFNLIHTLRKAQNNKEERSRK